MKAERLHQRYVRAIQRNRSIVAALLIPLNGCGADNEVDLAASTIDTDDATLVQGDLFWHIVPPQGPDDYWVRNAFRHRNCKNMKTKIDSNEPTTCSGNRFVVGIKMGYGHSSQYNVPHEIKCCELDRLIELGKRFDYFVYPNRDHGLAEGKGSLIHVRMLIARYLVEHLPPGPR